LSLRNIRQISASSQYLLLLVVVAGYFSLTQHHLFHELQLSDDVGQASHSGFGINDNPAEHPSDDSNVNESCVHCLVSYFTVADIPAQSIPVIQESGEVFKPYSTFQKLSSLYSQHRSRAPPLVS